MNVSKVTSKWQAVVLKAVRKLWGLNTGDSLEWIANDNGSFTVKSVVVEAKDFFGKYHYKVAGKKTLTDTEINTKLATAMQAHYQKKGF